MDIEALDSRTPRISMMCSLCRNFVGDDAFVQCSLVSAPQWPDAALVYKKHQNAQVAGKVKKGACIYNPLAYHLALRPELIEWLKGLSSQLQFNDITYYLSIRLLDSLLSYFDVPDHLIKLATYLALHLAAKLHEEPVKIPSFRSVIDLFGYEFTMDDLTGFETHFFTALDYYVNRKTVYTEVQKLLDAGAIFCSDFGISDTSESIQRKIRTFNVCIRKLLASYPLVYELYRFETALVALTMISAARKRAGLTKLPLDLKLNKEAIFKFGPPIETLLEPLIVDTFGCTFDDNPPQADTCKAGRGVRVSLCETEIDTYSDILSEDNERAETKAPGSYR